MDTTTNETTATRQRMAITSTKEYVPVQKTVIRLAQSKKQKVSTTANELWLFALEQQGIEIHD